MTGTLKRVQNPAYRDTVFLKKKEIEGVWEHND